MYVYSREYRYKDNVSMVENNTMVSARNVKSFVFLREKSVGDPAEDNITTVNIPAWVSHDLNIKWRAVDIRVLVRDVCSFRLRDFSFLTTWLQFPFLGRNEQGKRELLPLFHGQPVYEPDEV